MMLNALEYYKQLSSTQIILIYSGPIWAVSVEELGETVCKRLELEDLSFPATQSIFSVFVEQMNNISMYSAEKEHFEDADVNGVKVSKGVFILGTSGSKYFLQTGNVVEKHSAELLKSRIDHLNSLDKQELRKYYKQQLNSENTNADSKGAGLGLIEIARRASSKIEYDFTPMEDGLIFFTTLIEMNGGK